MGFSFNSENKNIFMLFMQGLAFVFWGLFSKTRRKTSADLIIFQSSGKLVREEFLPGLKFLLLDQTTCFSTYGKRFHILF